MKIGQIKKIQIYLQNNKDKFILKPYKEIITTSSKEQDVKSFFEKYLAFKGNLNDINGKKMLELTIEDMKNIGLNLGQRKKLIKYIEYVKTIKNEELVVNENSTEEEVAKFLKEKMNFPDKTINELVLDGESLFSLTLKNFLN